MCKVLPGGRREGGLLRIFIYGDWEIPGSTTIFKFQVMTPLFAFPCDIFLEYPHKVTSRIMKIFTIY